MDMLSLTESEYKRNRTFPLYLQECCDNIYIDIEGKPQRCATVLFLMEERKYAARCYRVCGKSTRGSV